MAGGYFNSGGGTSLNNIALWDGQAWQPLGSGVSSSYMIFNSIIINSV